MSLTGNQQTIAGLQPIDPNQIRFGPIADLFGLARARQNHRANGGGILTAWIIIGDNHPVRMRRSRLPH